jgi:hypothetical protein
MFKFKPEEGGCSVELFSLVRPLNNGQICSRTLRIQRVGGSSLVQNMTNDSGDMHDTHLDRFHQFIDMISGSKCGCQPTKIEQNNREGVFSKTPRSPKKGLCTPGSFYKSRHERARCGVSGAVRNDE